MISKKVIATKPKAFILTLDLPKLTEVKLEDIKIDALEDLESAKAVK